MRSLAFASRARFWGTPPPQPHLRMDIGVDPALLPASAELWPVSVAPSADGRLDAAALIAAQNRQGKQPLILVVSHRLCSAGCASLYGLANPRAQVAVVSVAPLRSNDPALTRERLAKVIAHEWMHLSGRAHCRQAGCLMHPVSTVDELDLRGEALCDRCRRPGVWRGAVAAIVCALALFGGLDLTVNALQTKSRPFHLREGTGASLVYYQSEEILRIPPQAASATTARRIAPALNKLFTEIDPAPLLVERTSGEVRVVAGGSTLLVIDAAVSGERAPLVFAREWTARWNRILEAKGLPHESCPQCHIERRSQVREVAARPPRFWR